MKNYLLVSMFCIIGSMLFAQQKRSAFKKQLKFSTVTQLGLLAGNTSSSAAVQLINGVTYKKMYVGLGTGLDYYLYRGFPFFADVRYQFSQQRNSMFVYADGGIHFPWQQKNINGVEVKLKSGLYTDLGFGYKLTQKNGNALVISFGYTHKKVSEERKEFVWGPIIRDANVPHQTVKYNYGLNRIAIKFGLMF